MKKLLFLLFSFIFMIMVNADDFRTWTSSSGEMIVAQFISCDKSTLFLECTNGVKRQINHDYLSTNDVTFLCEYILEQRKMPIQKDTFFLWMSTASDLMLAKFKECKNGYVLLESINGSPIQIKYSSLMYADQLAVQELLGRAVAKSYDANSKRNDDEEKPSKSLSDLKRESDNEGNVRNRTGWHEQSFSQGQQMPRSTSTESVYGRKDIEKMNKRGLIRSGDIILGGGEHYNVLHANGRTIESGGGGYIARDKYGNIDERFDKNGNSIYKSRMTNEP